EARMGVGQLVELGVHGREHVGVAVAEAGDGGAARGVDVLPAAGIPDADALPALGHGVAVSDGAMEDAGHAVLSPTVALILAEFAHAVIPQAVRAPACQP